MPFPNTPFKSPAGSSIIPQGFISLCLLIGFATAQAQPQLTSDFGLRAPAGFEIILYAGTDLAPTPQAIALDAQGRVVVTGPGYLRTLFDVDSDGTADRFASYAPTPEGTALAVDGPELLLSHQGSVVSYIDNNFDGVAEGNPNTLLRFSSEEEGIHSIRRGPDGAWYFAGGKAGGGNQQKQQWGLSSITNPQAGVLLRWGPGEQSAQIIAHGFRNPLALEFNVQGDLFTLEADASPNIYLPSYTPSRLFHIQYGGHHGWQTSDPNRDAVRPGYLIHGTTPVFNLGRAIPKSLVTYRHYQFPEYYRNGLFVADWLNGRVHFVSLSTSGSSYQTVWETFLEGTGRSAFTPTDLAIMPDGSLLVAAGGNRIPGGLFRIQYVADAAATFMATNWMQFSATDLSSVLQAPQPLDAWSREYWAEAALNLGPDPFANTVLNNLADLNQRIRSIEILTEIHGGLGEDLAASAAYSDVAEIRDRVAWSLGRAPCPGCLNLLIGLAQDAISYVRVQALDALILHASELDMASMQKAIGFNLAHPDSRVRAAAIRLGSNLTEPAWNALWALLKKSNLQARLTGAALALQRPSNPPVNEAAVAEALAVLAATRDLNQQMEAVELIQVGLGLNPAPTQPDINQLPEGYQSLVPLAEFKGITDKVGDRLNALFPTRSEPLNRECARLLAMLENDNLTLPGRLIKQIQPRSDVASDMHYLAVLGRLPASSLTNVATELAKAFLGVSAKLPSDVSLDHLHWDTWQTAILQSLLTKIPNFTLALLQQPNFASPGHERWVPSLESNYHQAAALQFLNTARKSHSYPWSPPLVDILSVLPPPQIIPLLSRQWSKPELREAMIPVLAKNPLPSDQDKYVWGLGSDDPEVLGASLTALLKLPLDPRGNTVVASLRLLRRLFREPDKRPFRAQIVELLKREPDFPFTTIPEQGTSASLLENSYAPIFDWFAQTKRTLFAQLDKVDGENLVLWESKFAAMELKTGNSVRGRLIYQDRGCQGCHTGTSHLGPDLGGIGLRLPRRAIFDSVVFPNRTIESGYRTTIVELKNRTTYQGVVAHEDFDLLFLQPNANSAFRLNRSAIQSQYVSHQSFMPAGLLQGLDPQALADLFAFISTLPPQTPAR